MPMPFTYQLASAEYEAFLADLIEISGLATRNQAYTTTRSVLHVFRRHIDPQAALDFANMLPCVLRAIFIEDWTLSDPITPFPDRARLTTEVKAIREAHNFSPDSAIADVAKALKHAMKPEDHHNLLAPLSHSARAYWHVDP